MYNPTRRSLISVAAASAATFALGSNRAMAEYLNLSNEDTYISELTGAEIALGSSGLQMQSKHNQDSNRIEVVLISNDTSVTAIMFIPAGTPGETYIQDEVDELVGFYPAAEEAGSGVLPDGAWLAMGIATQSGRQRGVYVEHQVGAFPEHDLVINFTADLETFADDFDLLQQLTIEGFEPCLFVEESQVETLVFPALSIGTTSDRGTGTSRTSRGNTGSDSTGSRRSSRGTSSTSTDSTYVDDVRVHRSAFLSTFVEFLEAVGVFADDNRTDLQVNEAFDTMDQVADIWIGYPDQAEGLTAPAELGVLEDLYLTWADEIGELGSIWLAASSGVGEVGIMFDQIDVVNTADKTLKAELDSLD